MMSYRTNPLPHGATTKQDSSSYRTRSEGKIDAFVREQSLQSETQETRSTKSIHAVQKRTKG
jgi:hypothetical protein